MPGRPLVCLYSRLFLRPITVRASAAVVPLSTAFRGADFEIFDEDTTRQIEEEHVRDMDDAARAIGKMGTPMRMRQINHPSILQLKFFNQNPSTGHFALKRPD